MVSNSNGVNSNTDEKGQESFMKAFQTPTE